MTEHISESHIPISRLDEVLARLKKIRGIEYWLLAAITLLAAALRFYKLGQWSFWIDEIFTVNRAQAHFSNLNTLLRNLPTTLWLPLSLIFTEGFLKVFGVSEWSARLAPALIGIISILILYFPTRRLIGSRAAFIMVLLLAISPWHLFWSQNARFYTSLMLLYTLAGFAFFFAIESDRPIYILIFYVLFYFALSERMIAIFIFPVIFTYLASVWLFRFEHPRGLRKRNILLLLIPLLGIILFDILRFLATDSSFVVDTIKDFIGQQFEDAPRLAIAILFNVGLPIVSIGLLSGIYILVKKIRIGLFFLLSALLPVVMLLILNPFMFTKDRFVFMTLPFWLLLTALAIEQIISNVPVMGKWLAIGVLAVLVVEAAGTNLLYYRVNNGDRRDWKAAFEIVKQHSMEGDAYVAWWPEFGPYYLGRDIIPYKDVTPKSVVESGKRYWFIVDSETVYGNEILYGWLQKQAQLIEVLYLRMPEDDFNLRVYRYDPAVHSPIK